MADTILEPGTIIRPQLAIEEAGELIKKLYGITATCMKEFVSYDDRNFFFRILPGTDIHNEFLHEGDISDSGYMLKVTNWLDSKNEEFFDAQNLMILHLAEKGFVMPVPIKNTLGLFKLCETLGHSIEGEEAKKYMIRALKFIPGKTLFDLTTWSTGLFVQSGEFAARMDAALKDFSHEGFKNRSSIWFLSSVPKLEDFVHALNTEEKLNLVLDIINQFKEEATTVEQKLEKSIIHGDLNEQNLLIREKDGKSEDYEVFSAIDFGDCQYNPLIYELALVIMYMMTKCTEIHPNLVGGHVLAGYLPCRKLPELEINVLRTCVAARYAQSLTMGAYTHAQDPGNEYLLTTSKTGWKTLTEFWQVPKDILYSQWRNILADYGVEGF